MAIPSDKLERWTNYESAAISSAQDTHEHVRSNLEDSDSRLNNRGEMRFDTLLQGSYANTTIVHGHGDVDILVRMTNPFKGDTGNLSWRNRQQYDEDVPTFDDDYSVPEFQQDTYDALCDIYGSDAVKNSNKCIEIDSENCSLSLDADVVPCQEYRVYTTYNGDYTDPSNYFEGIRFNTNGGEEVINYPERHMEHGTDKNDDTSGNYKETIRILKNARNRLVELDQLKKETAPSYFIECLLYNVPDSYFTTSDYQERYYDIVSYLSQDSFRGYEVQHQLENLFGYSETQWSSRDATKFVEELSWLWDYGG